MEVATMSEKPNKDLSTEEVWHSMLTTGDYNNMGRMRKIFKYLPKDPRCAHCNAPFEGIGATLVKLFYEIQPSKMNPRMCNDCEIFAEEHQGGAEVELAMLFADVRGSTTIAEGASSVEFAQLIDRFYQVATEVLIHADALIEKLIGDEVTALFVPGYAGGDYTRRSIGAAQELLNATGHKDPAGPWVPVGVGVHHGRAFVGAVGSKEGVVEITALGDAVNIAARLASQAGPGEIIVSEEAILSGGLDGEEFERRRLSLKGRSEPVDVRIMRVDAG
jgi:adenylate cyclase